MESNTVKTVTVKNVIYKVLDKVLSVRPTHKRLNNVEPLYPETAYLCQHENGTIDLVFPNEIEMINA